METLNNQEILLKHWFGDTTYINELEPSTRERVHNVVKNVSFRSILEADGNEIQYSEGKDSCICPFHSYSSTKLIIDDHRAHCVDCEFEGNVVGYEMSYYDVPVEIALDRLEGNIERTDNDHPRCAVRPGKLNKEQSQLLQIDKSKHIGKLLENTEALDSLCDKLEQHDIIVTPGTLEYLAKGGVIGMSDDKLHFIYPEGIKSLSLATKTYEWTGVNPVCSIWREDALKDAKLVYIAISEIEAIHMIENGTEKETGAKVIAIPPYSRFTRKQLTMLDGKVAVFLHDKNNKIRCDWEENLMDGLDLCVDCCHEYIDNNHCFAHIVSDDWTLTTPMNTSL